MDTKPNWIKIRNEYETSKISYRDLAQKYKVSFNTLQDIAKREEWARNKQKAHDIITTKTRQKSIEKISDENIDRNIIYIELVDSIIVYCKKLLSTNYLKSGDIARLMEAIEKAQKVHMTAENKIDVVTLRRLENDEKRLEIMARKAGEDDGEIEPNNSFLDALKEDSERTWHDEEC